MQTQTAREPKKPKKPKKPNISDSGAKSLSPPGDLQNIGFFGFFGFFGSLGVWAPGSPQPSGNPSLHDPDLPNPPEILIYPTRIYPTLQKSAFF